MSLELLLESFQIKMNTILYLKLDFIPALPTQTPITLTFKNFFGKLYNNVLIQVLAIN